MHYTTGMHMLNCKLHNQVDFHGKVCLAVPLLLLLIALLYVKIIRALFGVLQDPIEAHARRGGSLRLLLAHIIQ